MLSQKGDRHPAGFSLIQHGDSHLLIQIILSRTSPPTLKFFREQHIVDVQSSHFVICPNTEEEYRSAIEKESYKKVRLPLHDPAVSVTPASEWLKRVLERRTAYSKRNEKWKQTEQTYAEELQYVKAHTEIEKKEITDRKLRQVGECHLCSVNLTREKQGAHE